MHSPIMSQQCSSYFSLSRNQSRLHITFNCHVAVVSFNMKEVLNHFIFHDTNAGKAQAHCFVEFFSIQVCLMLPHDPGQVMHFGQEYYASDVTSLSRPTSESMGCQSVSSLVCWALGQGAVHQASPRYGYSSPLCN